MNKLAHLIRALPEKELKLLKQDLDEGNLQRLLAERLAEMEFPQKICPVCHASVTDDAPFVLFFGQTVRQKARFDGIDCLQFFLKDLRQE